MLPFLTLALSLLVAPVAVAPEPATTVSPVQIDKPAYDGPEWWRRPSADFITRVYPAKAKRRGLPGRVILDCTIGLEGKMKTCSVVSETPARYGFGEAGLTLASAFQVTATTRTGKSTEGMSMRIPISFGLLE